MLDDNEMRVTYAQCLLELADKNPKIVVCEADLMSANGTKPFLVKYPERTFNVGVAEANMMGVAAGLANEGFVPFANSFTPFATRRCFDQIAISVNYARLNVKICGTDPGITAESNGGTHMSFEDAGIMRNLPNMAIVEPIDSASLKALLPQIAEYDGPVYFRIPRKKAEKVYNDGVSLKIGKADVLKDGKDVAIFAMGLMVSHSLVAADLLAKEGINAKVVNMHTLKPIDKEEILKAARETGAIVTAENHSVINGLGSAVAEVLSENCPTPLKRVGVLDDYGQVALKDYLAKFYKMTAEDISAACKEVLGRKK